MKGIVTALGVYLHEEPGIGPNKYNFDENVLYQIHVALGSDVAAGKATLSYEFKFDTTFRNRNTILQSYLASLITSGTLTKTWCRPTLSPKWTIAKATTVRCSERVPFRPTIKALLPRFMIRATTATTLRRTASPRKAARSLHKTNDQEPGRGLPLIRGST